MIVQNNGYLRGVKMGDSPFECDHGNDVPTYCSCYADCYCREHGSCPKLTDVEIPNFVTDNHSDIIEDYIKWVETDKTHLEDELESIPWKDICSLVNCIKELRNGK